jgi:hypothetical protein
MIEEDEEWTYLDEIKGWGGKKLDATTTQGNIEEKPKPNLDQVIDNIKVELVISIELVVSIIEPTSRTT